MVTHPANTGITANNKKAVINHPQTKIGIFIQVMPGARILKMVTTIFNAAMIEEAPIMCTEKIKKSVLLGP